MMDKRDTILRLPVWLMGPGQSPQQIRDEMPEFKRVTSGHESELAPLIKKDEDRNKQLKGEGEAE
ncbi:hypothetical protein D3C79_1056020 [compost metagenome]